MYVNPNIFQIDFANLTDWDDTATNGAATSISPAGQLYFDIRGATTITRVTLALKVKKT